MKNKDLTKVIQGVIAVVIGVLIAVFGFVVVDTYFGILAIVAGSILLILAIYAVANKKPLPLSPLALGGALIAIGIGTLVGHIGFGVLVWIIVYALLGIGAAFIIYGVYVVAKGHAPVGVAFLAIGAGLIALSACFIFIDTFRDRVFWIITGILVAAYGALTIILALTEKKK